MPKYVVTAQYPAETYQPIVFGPFSNRMEALQWVEHTLKAFASNKPHLRVTLLERPVVVLEGR